MTQIETPNLPALIPGKCAQPAPELVRTRQVPPGVDCALEAQRLGQENVRRGLRGGQAVLGAARTAYLSRQWSGDHDRRPAPGLLTRTKA